MNKPISFLGLGMTLFALGCAIGPNFHHPQVPKIHQYTESAVPKSTVASPTLGGESQTYDFGAKLPQEWWLLFHSKALNQLIEDTLHHNPEIQAAKAALKYAHTQTMIQRSAFLPGLTGLYSPNRQQTAGTLSSNLSSNAYLYTLSTEALTVSYMPDIYGLVRRNVESTSALEESAKFECEAIYLTLCANVVLAAIQEASLRKQIEATEKAIAIARKLLVVVRQQQALGDIGIEDLTAQATFLAQTEASLPPLQLQLSQNRHLLASLSGRYSSEDMQETFKLKDFNLPKNLPVSLPSTLVAHRPDIRAAEARLHSASANIGVAIANRLPKLTLGGSGGYMPVTQSINSIPYFLSLLPLGPSLFWTLGGNLAGTLFDAGSLLFQQRAAVANFDLTLALYRRTVLNAFQNVADALKAVEIDAIKLSKVKEQVDSAKLNLDIARRRHRLGDVHYINLLYAQEFYYQAIITLAQSRASRFADSAALFQAIGGGWSEANPEQIKPPYRVIAETLAIQLTSPFMLE